MSYERGSVVLVLFPDSNLRTAKRRPALVVQRNDLDSELDQAIVAMMTSRTFRANHSSRVLIKKNTKEGEESGVLSDSVIMTDNLATIRTSEIDRAIGSWNDMDEVDAALRYTLNL